MPVSRQVITTIDKADVLHLSYEDNPGRSLCGKRTRKSMLSLKYWEESEVEDMRQSKGTDMEILFCEECNELGQAPLEKLGIRLPLGRAEEIARVAHEMNKRWCELHNDNSVPSWEEAPGWQKKSIIAGIHFHRSRPDAGPEASHESWLEAKKADGWRYGAIKDPAKKTHPCFRPYKELPPIQRAKDLFFTAIVRAYLFNGTPHPETKLVQKLVELEQELKGHHAPGYKYTAARLRGIIDAT